MSQKKVSIVIPVFNEEQYIGQTIEIVAAADTRGFEKEIIIVDDGSHDKTVKKIKLQAVGLQKKHKDIKLKLIQKKLNEGKGAALREGFMNATGDIVIVQDGDLEYSPKDYPALLEPFLTNNVDVVYGSRFISDTPHRALYFWHYQANKFLTFFSNMFTNLNLTDMETGYKVFRGDLIREIAPRLQAKRFGFEPEITAKIAKIRNLKIYEVGVSYSGRTYEDGKKIGWKDGVLAVWEILKFNLLNK